ncbi:GAF domain-containing protein [Nocardia sp. NPDC049149]|uniref:GAF domain-containing protein n=1 Tax=Nocardia sp. NPDC049149 TaxID=3364315 RepID=UPI00372294E8
MRGEWLLIECIRHEATVMAVGRTPIGLEPLDTALGAQQLHTARLAISQVRATGQRWEEFSRTRDEHVIAEPIANVLGMVHGVRLWIGKLDDQVPPRTRSGAWDWNLDKMTALATDELHALYAVPPERRRTEISRVSSLRHVTAAEDPAEALAAALSADQSLVYQSTWQITRDDQVRRDINWAARGGMVGNQRFLHGLTHDITEGYDEDAPLPPRTFAEALVDADLDGGPDVYYALVDLKTLTAYRWLGAEMPGVAWELTGDPELDPALHPDDLSIARQIARAVQYGPATGTVRLRDTSGGWLEVDVEAKRLVLTHTPEVATALVEITRPGSGSPGLTAGERP